MTKPKKPNTMTSHRTILIERISQNLRKEIDAKQIISGKLSTKLEQKSFERDKIKQEIKIIDDALSASAIEQMFGNIHVDQGKINLYILTNMRFDLLTKLDTAGSVVRAIQEEIILHNKDFNHTWEKTRLLEKMTW